MMLVAFLFIIIALLSSILYFSLKKNLELTEELEKIVDDAKDSIEKLEIYQKRIQKVSELELFLDDPVTRELVKDIKKTKIIIKNVIQDFSEDLEEDIE